MQQLLSPDTFEFLARFFLAGWVFLSVRSWWVRGQRPKPNEVLFEAVTLSLVNQLLALFTLRGMLEPWTWLGEGTTQFLVAEVLVQPVLVGLLVGYVAERNWMPDGFRRLLMPAVAPVRSALGFAVDQINAPSFVIITYNDEHRVYGYFGENSFARSEGVGDIFIEALYSIEGEEWRSAQPPRGGWVTLEGVRTIEFISSEDL